MAVLPRLILPVSHENDLIKRNARLSRRFDGRLQKGRLRHQCLGCGVRELSRKLSNGIRRIGGTGDAAGPMEAIGKDGGVDAVWGEEAEDVPFLPAKRVL